MRVRVRGGTGVRHPTCRAYRLPASATGMAAAVVAVSAPARKTVAEMREKTAVRHPDRHIFPKATAAAAAAAAVEEVGARPKEVVLTEQLQDVRRKARNEHEQWRKRVDEMKGAVVAYRRRAEEADKNLKLVMDRLAEETLASDALAGFLQEKTDLLAEEQGRSDGLKQLVDALLKERTDMDAWADEPARGTGALALLLPEGKAAGPPRHVDTQARWAPGLLRDIYVHSKRGACACKRELAANGVTHARRRFKDTALLGKGAFGIVHRGRCKKTKKEYAIKTTKPGRAGTGLVREMIAYAMMGTHKNIIGVESLSDVAGAEGLVMEIAVCDMFKACTGRSVPLFSLAQQISFEADATEGLSYMHSLGIIHCDHKLENTLVCRSDGPTGFVGKVTDPGLWCGLGEVRGVRMGTLGRTPFENVLGEVEAAPNQDTFAVAVDLCFMLAHPSKKCEDINMWTHTSLMTPEERERLRLLQVQGGDANPFWVDVTDRTMSDGTLSRILLQPKNLNPALPPSELLKTCEVLRKTVSRDPTDRLSMTAMTAFLRTLAAKTAARLEAVAAKPTAAGKKLAAANYHADPVLMSPEDILDRTATATATPVRAPAATAPARAPAVVTFSQEMGGRGEALIDLVVSTKWKNSPIVPASGSPAEGPVAVNGGRGGDAFKGFVIEGRPSHTKLVGQLAEGEADVQRTPSLGEIAGWVHLAPAPVVTPSKERGTDGAGAVAPPVEAVEAGRGEAPSEDAKPQATERNLKVVMPSLDEIVGWTDLPPLPFPGSAAEALANRLEAEAALRGANSGVTGKDLSRFIFPHVKVAATDFTPPVPARPNAGYAYSGAACGSGGGGGGVGVGISVGVCGGGGGRCGHTGSSWETSSGGCVQKGEEVAVMMGGSDASITVKQVLARGFDTSAPTTDGATSPAVPHPHPRPLPRPPPGLSASPGTHAHQATNVGVRRRSTAPAVLLTPSAILQADGDGPVTPPTWPKVASGRC